MDIEYIREGDYLVPNLTLAVYPEENARPIGKYGLMREYVSEKPQDWTLQYDVDKRQSQETSA